MVHFFDESLVIAICFIIFIYLAYRPIKKAIVASLDARINEIKTKLAETEALKQEAKLLLDEIKQEMEAFEERKKSILESADISTQRLIETRKKEMELMLACKKDSAIKSIANQKEKASDQMRTEFIEAVTKTVRAYLIETKNNSVSDEEIITRLMNTNKDKAVKD
jgi:F-type H+-transporting ATPase subunit b